MPKFPKVLYAYWDEPENGEPILLAAVDSDGLTDGEKVGVYELKDVKTKRVVESLV